jgi:hypothetical protein
MPLRVLRVENGQQLPMCNAHLLLRLLPRLRVRLDEETYPMVLLLAVSLSAMVSVSEPRTAAGSSVVVPDITHLTLNSARDVLAASGLMLGNVTLDAEDGGATQVAGQSPLAGGFAPAGSDVAVVLTSLRVSRPIETPQKSSPLWAWLVGALVVVATSAGRAALGIPHIGDPRPEPTAIKSR